MKKKINEDLKIAGYNLLVTSELKMSSTEIYAAYHNLWRIEESFRVMRSQLDARPVYLQKEDTITGHFLICYLAVLLSRLLQFKILKNEYCSETLWDFIHDFRVAHVSERQYINLTKNTAFIKDMSMIMGLPLTSYFFEYDSWFKSESLGTFKGPPHNICPSYIWSDAHELVISFL